MALALVFSGFSTAAPFLVTVNPKDVQERQKSAKDAVDMIDILVGELMLQNGNPQVALANYAAVLDRRNDVAVAERAFELALLMNDTRSAQIILSKWQHFEPVATSGQKAAQWKLDLMQNKPEAWHNLANVVKDFNENDTARVFYVLTGYADSRKQTIRQDYKTLSMLAAKYPDMPEAALCLSAYASIAKDKAGTIKHLKKLAQLVPQPTIEVQYLLASVLKIQPDYLQAFFVQSEEALSTQWQQYQVDMLLELKQDEEAYRLIQKILQKDSSQAALYLQAGYLSQKTEKPAEESLVFYEKAYQLGGNTQDRAALLAGALSYDSREFEQAAQWFNTITEKPLIFDKNIFLAWIAVDGKEAKKAQKLIDEANRAYEKDSLFGKMDAKGVQLAIYRLGKKHNKYIALADELVQSATSEERKDLLLQDKSFYLSDIMGQPEKAIPDLRRLVAKDGENADYLNSLGYTLLSIKGHEQEAYTLIQKAYDKEPESAAINDSLGWALFKLNQFEKALPYLEFAFANMPNAEVAAHLGEVLWRLNRQDEARVIWTKGMAENSEDRVLRDTRKRFGIR